MQAQGHTETFEKRGLNLKVFFKGVGVLILNSDF